MNKTLRFLLVGTAFGVASLACAVTRMTLSFMPEGQKKATEVSLLSCVSNGGSPAVKTKTVSLDAVKPSVTVRFKLNKSTQALMEASQGGKVIPSLTILIKIEAGGTNLTRTSTYTNVVLDKIETTSADNTLGSSLKFTYEKVETKEIRS